MTTLTRLFDPGREIPSLDGWRALAILIVFASHAGLGRSVPGGLGVSLFFFLSGFLITTLMLREYASSGGIDIRAFYIRRLLRLGPPMLAIATLAYLLTAAGVLRGGATLQGFIAQVFYFANYYSLYVDPGESTPTGTGVFWSLAVEEHFYLLFPLVLLTLLQTGQRYRLPLWLGALCLGVLLWRIVLVSVFNGSSARIYYASDTRVDAILFGCLLSACCWRQTCPASRQPGWTGVWLTLAGIALLLLSLMLRDTGFRDTWRYTLQGIAFFPLFFYSVRYPGWGLFRLLNLPWVKQLGVYSYVIYLVHHLVIENLPLLTPARPGAEAILAAMVNAGLAATVSLAAASTLHRYLETPLRPWRERFAPNFRRRNASPPPAATRSPPGKPCQPTLPHPPAS